MLYNSRSLGANQPIVTNKQPQIDIKQAEKAYKCPVCPESEHPPITGAMTDSTYRKNSISRCMGCLSYWEVEPGPDYKITNIKMLVPAVIKVFSNVETLKVYLNDS